MAARVQLVVKRTRSYDFLGRQERPLILELIPYHHPRRLMQSTPVKRSRIRGGFTTAPSRWLMNIAIPALPVLACFLGGATQKWSEGIVLAFLGLILLANPPRFTLGPALNAILLALVGCVATAFLPARWFLQPAWRLVLANDF